MKLSFSLVALILPLLASPFTSAHAIEARWSNTGCNADNCLRALRNPTRSVVAPSFCSSYTAAVVTATTSLPTFATECGSGPTQSSRLTSACSCFQPKPTCLALGAPCSSDSQCCSDACFQQPEMGGISYICVSGD